MKGFELNGKITLPQKTRQPSGSETKVTWEWHEEESKKSSLIKKFRQLHLALEDLDYFCGGDAKGRDMFMIQIFDKKRGPTSCQPQEIKILECKEVILSI